jgi:T4-like virus tail tube protein gp19
MDERIRASRARFLGAAGITGAAIATGAWKAATVGAASQADKRGFTVGNFGLDFGNGWETFVKAVEGGHTAGEVVREAGSAPYYQKKHIGNVKYEEVTLRIGLPSPGVYDMLSKTLAGDNPRRTFWVSTLDASFVEIARRQFNDALITEIGFPALDASAREAAYVELTFAPESAEDRPASGKVVTLDASKQKTFLQSNFRLELKGVATARVAKVDAFTIRRTAVTGETGKDAEPGKLEFPDLEITFSAADQASWKAWFDDFVVKGNNADATERTGTLAYLDPTLLKDLLRIELDHVGIFRLEPEQVTADGIRRIKAELYVETMKVVLPA